MAGRLYKYFGKVPYRISRNSLGALSFPFDASRVSNKTMQAVVDEARAETESASVVGLTFWAAVRDAAIRHGIPFKHRMSEWMVTDAGCNQRCRFRVANDGRTVAYEYEQGDASAEIIVRDEDYLSEDFVGKYLNPYGYRDIPHVRSIYGDGWEQIVAECIFETDFLE